MDYKESVSKEKWSSKLRTRKVIISLLILIALSILAYVNFLWFLGVLFFAGIFALIVLVILGKMSGPDDDWLIWYYWWKNYNSRR